MPPLKQLKDIPTIAYLYRTKAIRPSKADLPKGDQETNNKVCTLQYDLTKLEVDAIVNAANKRLLGGGGVDGAIHMAAGRGLLEECKKLRGCETGSAKITDAYELPCKKVIHAVGPIYEDDEASEPLLRGCYKKALQLAVDNDCRSIAFSAISTGIYGYPSSKAAKAALREVAAFLRKPEGKKLDKIVFCSFLDKDVNAYAQTIPEVFAPTDEDLSESVLDPMESNSVLDGVQRCEGKTGVEGVQENIQAWQSFQDGDDHEDLEKSERQPSDSSTTSWTSVENGAEDRQYYEKISEKETADAQVDGEHAQLGKWNNNTTEPIAMVLDDANTVVRSETREPICDKPNNSHNRFVGPFFIEEDGGDSSGVRTEFEETDMGSQNGEWEASIARSRAMSKISTQSGRSTKTDVTEKFTVLKIAGCDHDWKTEDGSKNFNLWPKDRLRCVRCDMYIAPGVKHWAATGAGS